MHDVRVLLLLPPLVWNPGTHTVHDADPGALYLLSAPHGLTTLLPSHADPAAHGEHTERVFASTPVVKDPAAQVLHSVAPVVDAYIVSSLQLRHCVPSLLEYLPRVQRLMRLEPSHDDPGWHFEHVVRIMSALFPDVKYPTGHDAHSLAPAEL